MASGLFLFLLQTLADTALQKIAAEMNLAETAFIQHLTDDSSFENSRTGSLSLSFSLSLSLSLCLSLSLTLTGGLLESFLGYVPNQYIRQRQMG